MSQGDANAGVNRRLHLFVFLIILIGIANSPIAFSGLTAWNIAGWNWRHGDGSDDGPITFQFATTATAWTFTNDLVKFSDFEMGVYWADIGFACGPGGTMDISHVSNTEVRFSVTSTGGLKWFKVWVAGKGTPQTVEGGSSWNFSSSDQIVTVQADANADIIVSWAAADPAGPGGTTPDTTPGTDGGLEAGAVIPGQIVDTGVIIWSWLQTWGAYILVITVIGVVIYGQTKPTYESKKASRYADLFPNVDRLKKRMREYFKRIKEKSGL